MQLNFIGSRRIFGAAVWFEDIKTGDTDPYLQGKAHLLYGQKYLNFSLMP